MHKRVFVFTIKYRTIAISSKENILQKTLEKKKRHSYKQLIREVTVK